MKSIEGFSAAFKFYEDGVVSVALTLDFRDRGSSSMPWRIR